MPKKRAEKDKKTAEVKIKKVRVENQQSDLEKALKKTAIRLFGKTADKYSANFINVKQSLITSGTRMLFRTYISLMLFITAITFLITFVFTLAFVLSIGLGILFSLIGIIVMPSFFASIVFLLIYVYPISVSESRKRDLEANLPFAMTHMSAVAESGAPPLTIFKILAQFKEYGEVSKEAQKITRNVEVFGLDQLSALRDRSLKSPSPSFRNILQGILSTIQTGGNLRTYLTEESKKAMFEYTMRREKYNQLLSTYADLYTALLVAAPMIFIVVISTLSVMGGSVFGMSLEFTMILGLGILALLNMMFLVFIQITQPKM
ncbi:MAG: type II secretion system F family protein [Candidatus Aenigmatarchaeota archaeon]